MICEFCGYEFPDDLGRYGCPNCEGEGTMTNLYDNILEESRNAVISEMIKNADTYLNNVAIPNYSELVAAIERLAFAAECRDNTTGDPIRLIEVREELRAAAASASAILSRIPKNPSPQYRSAVGIEPGVTAEMESEAAGEFPTESDFAAALGPCGK